MKSNIKISLPTVVFAAIALLLSPHLSFAVPGDTVADAVIGEPDFTSSNGGATAALFVTADGVAVDPNSHRIYVADGNGNRILSWPSANSFTNGEAADLVIGQPDFTSTNPNRGGSASANTLFGPEEIAVDKNGNLFKELVTVTTIRLF